MNALRDSGFLAIGETELFWWIADIQMIAGAAESGTALGIL